VKAGEKTVFVTGGDPGAWGLDWGDNITKLLDEILKLNGDFKLFFHDFNVQWLIRFQDDLIPLLRDNQSRFGGLCIPVQSGSDQIIRSMRRPYAVDAVRNVFRRLKDEAPKVQLGTHFIVGFPGESEADFQATLALIKEVQLDFMMCYPYSDNKLAHAFDLPNKVPQNEISRRHELVMKTFKESLVNG